ncbi:MAG: hypothetical protein WED09_14160 [Homoserinimonas sp.]
MLDDDDAAGSLESDDLVRKLIPDPAHAAPNITVLTGWIGQSTREGYVRMYLVADLSEYVVFREEDVVHHEKVPAERAGLAATRVWLRDTAELQHTRRLPQAGQRQFLGGTVAAAFLSRFPRPGMHGGGFHAGGGALVSVPPQASVCFSCPTEGGEDTCVPATCTLSTSCQTQFLCL